MPNFHVRGPNLDEAHNWFATAVAPVEEAGDEHLSQMSGDGTSSPLIQLE